MSLALFAYLVGAFGVWIVIGLLVAISLLWQEFIPQRVKTVLLYLFLILFISTMGGVIAMVGLL